MMWSGDFPRWGKRHRCACDRHRRRAHVPVNTLTIWQPHTPESQTAP